MRYFAPRIMPPLPGFAFVFLSDSRGSRPLRGSTPGYLITPLPGLRIRRAFARNYLPAKLQFIAAHGEFLEIPYLPLLRESLPLRTKKSLAELSLQGIFVNKTRVVSLL